MKRLWILAALALTACIPKYQEPLRGDATATLILSRREHNVMFGGGQMFNVYDNASCKKTTATTGRLGGFSQFSKEDLRLPISAGSRSYLRALTAGGGGGRVAGELVQTSCVTLVSFTPMPGRTYAAAHIPASDGCAIALVDTSNGEPPADVAIEAVPASCRF